MLKHAVIEPKKIFHKFLKRKSFVSTTKRMAQNFSHKTIPQI